MAEFASVLPAAEANPALAAEQQAKENVALRMVLTEHEAKDGPAIAAALEGCDTVVFEYFGQTAAARQMIEQGLNAVLDPQFVEHKQALLQQAHAVSPYIAETMASLPESVTQVRLFDMDNQHPAFGKTLAGAKDIQAWGEGVYNNEPNSVLRGRYMQAVVAGSTMSATREALMNQQLDAIAEDIAVDGEKHVVGVINGANHTDIAHNAAAHGYETETVVLTADDPFVPGEKARLDYVAEALNRVNEGDYSVMSPEMADRAIIYTTAAAKGLPPTVCRSIMGVLTDHEVSELAAKLDEIKAGEEAGRSERLGQLLVDELQALVPRAVAIGGILAAAGQRR